MSVWVLALQYGTIGLSLGCYIGHKVTNWLWKRRVEQLKLDWTEELFERKPATDWAVVHGFELCVCGHRQHDHAGSTGDCCGDYLGEDSGLCPCSRFRKAT